MKINHIGIIGGILIILIFSFLKIDDIISTVFYFIGWVILIIFSFKEFKPDINYNEFALGWLVMILVGLIPGAYLIPEFLQLPWYFLIGFGVAHFEVGKDLNWIISKIRNK